MDIGGSKTEAPRQFLQENTTRPAGSSTPASSSNLPLDNARPVALETTPSPLSYWPPSASALPLKIGSPVADPTPKPDPRNLEESPPVTHPALPPRILHHNLPPIAGITSYRGLREIHKHSNPPEEPKPEKTSAGDPADGKNAPPKAGKPEDGADCEIVEVPAAASSVERNSEYVFSIPAAVGKPLMSPKAPTPLVPSPAPEANSSVGSPSGRTAPSPSGRTAPSPSGRTAPSPSGRTVPSPGRTAPSPHFISPSPPIPPPEIPRILPSNRVLSSPSPHRKLPSPVDCSRILPSPHDPLSLSQRGGGYIPNPHATLTYLNAPRANFHESLRQPNQPPRVSLANPQQRISHPTDNQICRNPFELPLAKAFYHSEQQPSNVRESQFKLPGFYPPSFKPLPGKDADAKYKPNSQPRLHLGDQNAEKSETHGFPPKHPDQSKAAGWVKPETADVTYINTQNFNKVNGNEFPTRKMPEIGYQKQTPPDNFGGRFNEKQSGGFSQLNSLSQRFPPVPQSNYDLNRHIYDSMIEGGRAMHMGKFVANKTHPYYREEHDKSKNYIQTVKRNEFGLSPGRLYGQFSTLLEKAGPDAYQRPGQHQANPQPGFGSKTSTSHQLFPQIIPEYEGKKLLDLKSSSQFIIPQTKINRAPTSTTVSARAKRESPLDLSVKTVRQSADSTAKDEGDVYLQSFRSFMQHPRYPISQLSGGGVSGAPKIDFTPNFSGFHTEAPATSHHKAETSTLPPVESFKKFPARLPSPVIQEGKNRTGVNPPKYFPGQKDPNVRFPEPFRPEIQKRIVENTTKSHSSPAKVPRIDPWKLAFDQEIEQRLNSARMSHQNSHISAMDALKPPPAGSQYPSSYLRHSGNHYRATTMYPQPPSMTPYNPSYIQQPQCQPPTPQTPQEKLQHRENVGHSPDPEQIIKQISKGVMPDHKLLQDKNVISILRSSLEEKEAKLLQLREVAKRKEKYKERSSPDLGKKSFHPYDQSLKSHHQGKQSLPPFGALSIERMCAPPSFPGHRLNLPRPVDAVKIDVEPTQKYFGPAAKKEAEKIGVPKADLSPRDDVKGHPTDLDGLAAFLAARIRTKGELKQVGPTLEPGKSGLPQHPKTQSGKTAFVSQPLDKATAPTHAPPPTLQTNVSPPKLVRESRLLPPIRRRYFSHTDDETPSTSGTQNEDRRGVPPRDPGGIRSSSETSVFDFRESDSEGEMPVLERQTLEEMRRDRKTHGSRLNMLTTPKEARKPEVIAELDKTDPDPFWHTTFDLFVEQLKKRPPKRSVRKKKQMTTQGSETEELEKTENATSDEGCVVTVKKEPEEKVEKVPGGHVKLSSSRLKVYRDEMRLKEEEKKAQKEAEKEMKKEVEKETKKELGREIKMEVETETKKEVEKETKKEVEKETKKEVEKETKKEVEKETKKEVEKETKKEVEKETKKEVEKETKKEVEKETKKEVGKETKKEVGKETKKEVGKETKKEVEKEIQKPEIKDEPGVKTRGRSKVLSPALEFDSDSEQETRSDTTVEDDDDSLSLSGLESESTDSEAGPDSENFSSSEDSENETMTKKKLRIQTRLQTKNSGEPPSRTGGMKLRSESTSVVAKSTKKRRNGKEELDQSGKKRKPTFGDGTEFRPGWEEECYKFKQQLRMPEKLISISRPPKRSTASLPDLHLYRNSPSLDSSDVSMTKKETGKPGHETDDSDVEPTQKTRTLHGSPDNTVSLLKSRHGKKSQGSIVNMLVDKYGKGSLKKQKDLKAMSERKSPRILPKATNKPELLPTPGLGMGKENTAKDKKKSKETGKKKTEEGESVYLGYFRRKTVSNFKEAFKQKVGLLPKEFSPVVLKSRTRTQMRDLKKRATLMEVFGDERPASAPPLSREEDTSTDQEKAEKSPEKKKPKVVKKVSGGMVTRGREKLTRSGRPGLRSTSGLRSDKPVQDSKKHLNEGRKRNSDPSTTKETPTKKFSCDVGTSEAGNELPTTKKRVKLKPARRKFRSGFDYIRKKKKKKDGESAEGNVKEKKVTVRPISESVEDIQNEIKSWVINKGLGETVLHRAARLGYCDITAYCLERLNSFPSPQDNAGYTPLHEACSRGHLEVARLLLMYGANVSESAQGGIRPLHEAAENGYTELIRLLLSYGADPLLETYSGHTALSLVTDEDAKNLLVHHLADVQGNKAPVWSFQGPASFFDLPNTGYNPLNDIPSASSDESDIELETSDYMLPSVFRLSGDRDPDRRWVLLRDAITYTRAKSKEALLRQLGTVTIREMKLSDFREQSSSCSFLGFGDKIPTKASKVILIPYDDKLRRLMGVVKDVI